MVKIHFPPEWGIDPVPSQHRMLRGIDFFVLWSSLGVGLLVLTAGGLLSSLNLGEALIAIVLGSIIGSALLGWVGMIGSKYGLPAMVTVRSVFGVRGSYFPSALNILQLLGWTIFEIIIMAQAADAISISLAGFSNYPLWVAVFAVIVALMTLGGPILVIRHWLEKFAIWIAYATAGWLIIYLGMNFNIMELLAKPGSGGMSFLVAVDLVIAMPVSWMPLAADYNRFAREARGGFRGTFTGYSMANIWFYALGVLLVLALNTTDVVGAFTKIGFGLVMLMLILVDETDNTFADVYSASISTQNILPKLKQKRLHITYIILGAVLALLIPITQYEVFLLLIGAMFIPVFGIVLTDHYILKRGGRTRGKPSSATVFSRGINFLALITWAVGALIYYVTSPLSPIFIPALSNAGSSIPSLIGASVLYMVLHKTGRRHRTEG